MRLFEQLKINPVVHVMPNGSKRKDESVLVDLDEAVRVVVDNVADFYWRTRDEQLGDYMPNIAPPWPNVFFEWVVPRFCPDMAWGTAGNVLGVWIRSYLMESAEAATLCRKFPRGTASVRKDAGGWLASAEFFCSVSGAKEILNPCFFIFQVSRDGKIGSDLGKDGWSISTLPREMHPKMLANLNLDAFPKTLHIPFFSTSFAHCKNVELRRVEPDAKLSKKQLKRYGVPKFSYDVIDIQPMTKVLRTEGGMDSHGSLSTALHICRGHFKDYRQRGLFGKNKGLYWWDMHVRGDEASGVAKRDYTISPAQEDRPDV